MEKEQNKPKAGWSRLLQIAATKKPYMITSIVFSVLSSIVSFVPYIAVYYIVREILGVYPDYGMLEVAKVLSYGWWALGGIIANILLYFLALACSHLAAFGTLYELKINFATHLAKVPLGFHTRVGSGKLRKIMDENIEKIEKFIAHQLPDIVAAMVAPFVMIVILLAMDWRYGIAALVGVVVAFIIQMRAYGNEGAKENMRKYQIAIEDMNNASVEYVRGISVVKAFKQTVYSFKRLYDTIKYYTKIVLEYTLSWENYMSAFTTVINNIYLFILPMAILVGINATNYIEFSSTLIFYLTFVPSIAGVMMKVMYVSSNGIRIMDGVAVMDKYLAVAPLAQPNIAKQPRDYDIEFANVGFSYDKDEGTEALHEISFVAKQGEITAIVGPSGGGKTTIAHLIPRFFDVSKGAIMLGGVDLRDMNSVELMKKVSFVFQDVFLFKQSVMENIRMGNENASDEQVIAAAKAAQCHDFIEKLPQGYHTVIGTKGVH